MSKTVRVSGKLRKVDLSNFNNSVEEWSKNLYSIDYKGSNNFAEFNLHYSTFKEYVEEIWWNKFIFLKGFPYEILSKKEYRNSLDFSEVKNNNNDGTLDFHCLWYNGGASLEEVITEGFENMEEE